MSDFIDRFDSRGSAIKAAYTGEDSRAKRPNKNPLVSILVDVEHRAAIAGLDFGELCGLAHELFEFEDSLVGDLLKEHAAEKAAARISAVA